MLHALAVFMNVASAAAAQIVSCHQGVRSAPCDMYVNRMYDHAEDFTKH
jgi:hypothetical protein